MTKDNTITYPTQVSPALYKNSNDLISQYIAKALNNNVYLGPLTVKRLKALNIAPQNRLTKILNKPMVERIRGGVSSNNFDCCHALILDGNPVVKDWNMFEQITTVYETILQILHIYVRGKGCNHKSGDIVVGDSDLAHLLKGYTRSTQLADTP